MRHLKFTLRLSSVALFALALLTPMLPARTNVIAEAGRAPAVGDKDDKEKRNDRDDVGIQHQVRWQRIDRELWWGSQPEGKGGTPPGFREPGLKGGR